MILSLTGAVLAHSWGWDELLFFGIPIVLALVGIRWVERRAGRRYAETHADGTAEDAPKAVARPGEPPTPEGDTAEPSVTDNVE